MKRAVAVVKSVAPVVKVLYKNRKTELALLLAAEGIIRQIVQALN